MRLEKILIRLQEDITKTRLFKYIEFHLQKTENFQIKKHW